MPRIAPLARAQLPDFLPVLEAIERDHGYVPNSFLTMGRDPALLRATGLLADALWYPPTLEPAVRNLVAFGFSLYSGAMYSAAHTGCDGGRPALPPAQIAALHDADTAEAFGPRERALLRLCRAAARAPGEVTDEHLAALQPWFSELQQVVIAGLIAWHAFLNKWNDIMDTSLEPLPRACAHTHLAAGGWFGGRHQ